MKLLQVRVLPPRPGSSMSRRSATPTMTMMTMSSFIPPPPAGAMRKSRSRSNTVESAGGVAAGKRDEEGRDRAQTAKVNIGRNRSASWVKQGRQQPRTSSGPQNVDDDDGSSSLSLTQKRALESTRGSYNDTGLPPTFEELERKHALMMNDIGEMEYRLRKFSSGGS